MQERGSLALTSILIQGAISVLAGGSLRMHDSSFSDTLAVSGTATLSGCTLASSATIDLSGGGALSLASVIVPGVGEFDGHQVRWFAVISGPCTVSEGGRCVGRPEGYGPDEDCAITVVGGGGVLGPCPVFDTDHGDSVTLPGGARHGDSDCPEGAALAPGDAIAWTSNAAHQGSVGAPSGYNGNGCAAKGTCGLPFSQHGLGGGWELCFA